MITFLATNKPTPTTGTGESHTTEGQAAIVHKKGNSFFKCRLPMTVALVFGIIVMIIHDQFNYFLHNKRYGSEENTISKFLHNGYAPIGTFISTGGKICLSSAMAYAFVQIFWYRLRRNPVRLRSVDDVAVAMHQPFGPSSLRAVFKLPSLAVFIMLGASMDILPVFAPSALHVWYESKPTICTRPTVDLSNAKFGVWTIPVGGNTSMYDHPDAQTNRFASRVIMSGSYLPFSFNTTSKDLMFESYSYDIQFFAPAFQCFNISAGFDFASALPPPPSQSDPAVIWNATYNFSSDNGLVLQVATTELVTSENGADVEEVVPPMEAVRCAGYNASYDAFIEETASAVAASVANITFVNPLSKIGDIVGGVNIQFAALADAVARMLNGTATYDPSTFDFTALVVRGPIGAANNNSAWSWTGDMADILQSLMQNVSLSLLSGQLSESIYPSLTTKSVPCNDFAFSSTIANSSSSCMEHSFSLPFYAFAWHLASFTASHRQSQKKSCRSPV